MIHLWFFDIKTGQIFTADNHEFKSIDSIKSLKNDDPFEKMDGHGVT